MGRTRARTAEGIVLEVRLLGDMQVRLHGAVVPVTSGRKRLLARLALAEGRFVPVAQLIDDLWEERPPDSAMNALQVHVSGCASCSGRQLSRREAAPMPLMTRRSSTPRSSARKLPKVLVPHRPGTRRRLAGGWIAD